MNYEHKIIESDDSMNDMNTINLVNKNIYDGQKIKEPVIFKKF